MKTFLTVVVLAVFSLCSGAAALAQQGVMWRGGGGWGSGMPYSRMFNPQTVETIRGVVVLVEKIAPMRGMAYGVHAVVKTDKETISVHLGPDWYITNQDVRIEAPAHAAARQPAHIAQRPAAEAGQHRVVGGNGGERHFADPAFAAQVMGQDGQKRQTRYCQPAE